LGQAPGGVDKGPVLSAHDDMTKRCEEKKEKRGHEFGEYHEQHCKEREQEYRTYDHSGDMKNVEHVQGSTHGVCSIQNTEQCIVLDIPG
jgi:hypothetical protein